MNPAILLCAIPAVYGYLIKPDNSRKDRFKTFTGRPYAHRGYHSKRKNIPENSMKAFKRAVKHNYGIELDVQLTKDKQCIILHDFNLERATGYPYEADQCDMNVISSLSLFESEENIPMFQDVLHCVHGQVPLIVEIKQKGSNCEVCEKAAQLLDQYPGDFMVESFNPIAVHWFKKHRPEWIRGQLAMNLKNDKSIPTLLKYPLEYLCTNAMTKPDFIAYHVKTKHNISFQLVHRLFKANTVLWTIRQPQIFHELKQDYDILIFEKFDPIDTLEHID